MKPFIKDYFSFNRRERNGILVLLGIIIILILYISFSKYFFNNQKVDFSGFEKASDEFTAPPGTLNGEEKSSTYTPPVGSNGLTKLFNFDPNNLTEEEWKQLGFKDWQIKAIEKYRSKAGDFYTKDDFKKLSIRVDNYPSSIISDEQYQLLKPYIQLPEEKRVSQKPTTDITIKNNKTWLPAGSSYVKPKIEINSTDTFELKQLKNIGSVYANRIIQYRNLLGGYFKKEQLLEVYGFDTSRYESISEFIEVDGSNLRKININFCSNYQLNQHPYITWNVANSIVNYRDRHGKYTSVPDIKKTDLVNDTLYLKIAPYLTIE